VLPEQRKDTQVLLRKAGISVKPQQVTADSAPVEALAGEIAPLRHPDLAAARPVSPGRAKAQTRPTGEHRQRRLGSRRGQAEQHSREHAGPSRPEGRRRARRAQQSAR
jgi:hypothetical protein